MNITSTYKENGITVKVLKGCEYKPRPARSTVESPKSKYASNLQQVKIMNWCNAGNIKRPRRTALSELSGISLMRVRGSITTGRGARMLLSEYKIYLSLMPVIEEMEKREGVKT